jgi:transposase-like protein
MRCLHCRSAWIVRNGISKHNKQRFLCKICHKTFGLTDDRKIGNHLKRWAMHLYLEGVRLREIEKLLGVSHVSVMKWGRAWKEIVAPPAQKSTNWIHFENLPAYWSKSMNDLHSGGVIVVLSIPSWSGKWKILGNRQ